MKFSDKVQQQFTEAGWFEGRDVSHLYANHPMYAKTPAMLKEFIHSYGDLRVLDCKNFESEVTGELIITLEYFDFFEEGDFEDTIEMFGFPVYPFAMFEPELYRIGCDDSGNIYMLGDGNFLRSNNFVTGIEKVLSVDWTGCMELNDETGEWFDPRKLS
ncbi:MAG: SUKH-3 domain-containing protein [Bacteroidia bacterium]|nr:SUKH-3 domain-containing protein [Bacteroidia bacterium]